MNFSQGQETEFKPKDLYLGKDKFKVIAVNPNNKTLKELGLYTSEQEPEYRSKVEVNGKEVNAVNITFIVQSLTTGNIERVSYRLVDSDKLSSTGKYLVINNYGGETWLEDSAITSKNMPSNMQWYIPDGVKKQVQGEKALIDFIRALRRIKNITNQSSEEDKKNSISVFKREDLDKLFKGDFTDLRNLITSTPENSVCFLLGVRSNDEGKKYQDIYRELPMQSWQKDSDRNDYLKSKVEESQQNGRYSNTFYDLSDFNLKKYDPTTVVISSPSNPEDFTGFMPEEDLEVDLLF